MMNNNSAMNVQDAPPTCANGCGFFGNPATQNLCSMCYRDFLKKTALETQEKPSLNVISKPTVCSNDDVPNSTGTITATSVKKTVNRCGACNKRVGLTGFACRCGVMYCGSHRLPEQHSCGFDHKGYEREALSKALYSAAECKAPKLDYML